jgi:DNA-3-methyladenine glycosylase II
MLVSPIVYSSPEDYLSRSDKLIRELVIIFGISKFANEKRKPFDSLAKTIISQQLSNSASNSIAKKIISIHGKRPFNAHRFIALSNESLRACGISNNKIKAIKGIAEACLRNEITYSAFKNMSDEEVLRKLTSYWGVGNWTAEIFMMFCLQRFDILPIGDAGLIRAHKMLYPNAVNLETTAENWRPYRAIAAGYLWQFLDSPQVHSKFVKD